MQIQGHHDPQQRSHAGIYELVIPSDHLLRKIAATVHFDFAPELVMTVPQKGTSRSEMILIEYARKEGAFVSVAGATAKSRPYGAWER